MDDFLLHTSQTPGERNHQSFEIGDYVQIQIAPNDWILGDVCEVHFAGTSKECAIIGLRNRFETDEACDIVSTQECLPGTTMYCRRSEFLVLQENPRYWVKFLMISETVEKLEAALRDLN